MLLSERMASGDYYYVSDPSGSIVALTSPSGTVSDTEAYDPYGVTTATTGSVPIAFGFQGGFQLPGGLYSFGERDYDPGTGRWTQPDASAASGDPTQANVYSFDGDDPVNNQDPGGGDFYFYFGNLNTARTVGQVLEAGGGALSSVPIPNLLAELLAQLSGAALTHLGQQLETCGSQRQKKKHFYSCTIVLGTASVFGFDTCVPDSLPVVEVNRRRQHGCGT